MLRSKIKTPNTVKHSLERLAELLGPGCSDVQHRNNPMLPPGGGQVSHLVNLGSSCASDETCNRWNPTWLEPQGRCDQKSKIGVSMVPQKALLSSKFFL